MKQMTLKQKLNFETIDERILKMLENGYTLDYVELDHIFKNTAYRVRPNYKRLCQSIMFLLETMNNDELSSLVQLLNTDFEYSPNWKIDINTLEDRFSTWTYTCKNPETSKYLVGLAEKMRTEKKNNSLSQLKNTIEEKEI